MCLSGWWLRASTQRVLRANSHTAVVTPIIFRREIQLKIYWIDQHRLSILREELSVFAQPYFAKFSSSYSHPHNHGIAILHSLCYLLHTSYTPEIDVTSFSRLVLNLTPQMPEKRALNKSLISKITSAVATSRLKARKNRDLENETI